MDDHEPEPSPAVAGGRLALCKRCTEKIKKLDDGTWVHFGQDIPYEPVEHKNVFDRDK